ncbi:MAG: phosphoribosylformylglycinamidine synthase subunit PurL [Nitrospirae bacterium]|nr:phosphoribosylformylglycinamidine synthase subunit PurL [Candidatus Troglogloeales bacterium]
MGHTKNCDVSDKGSTPHPQQVAGATCHAKVVPPSSRLLSDDEYKKILDLLGREPNSVELAMFSVMWSEHCSYKSSRVHLKRFPTVGERVIFGPGENAGVVDIGNGLVAAFKIESHNHPSFIEPYQGAATGVGGIIRDIFTMGARPIALLNALRFGPLQNPKNRYLMEQVVAGIAGYGNCVGVPTVGGDISFNETYTKNPLVNAFCLGIARREDIVKGAASGIGNPVIYVGSKTGRDGIHGATMASTGLEHSKESRPAVQVGDPFTEKLLLEACLELIGTGCVVGMQDMGAAGLTCATSEMADRGAVGIKIDLAKVPLRESGMTPEEILISESQERMLIVVKKGMEKEAEAVFLKWDLDFSIIGTVTDDGCVTVTNGDIEVARVPADVLTSKAPVYERPLAAPQFQEILTSFSYDSIPLPSSGSYSASLLTLLSSPNLASKEWVYQQFDYMVQTNTVVGPGIGVAILRIKEFDTLLAFTLEGNSAYSLLNPYYSGANAVAGAALRLICTGAKPIGMTNCLNFGNPERPETMWALALSIEGMSDACKAFAIPVVSGNVSLYNETAGFDIYPTPIVGMVGLIESPTHSLAPVFKSEGEIIILIGETLEEMGGSVYLKEIYSQERGSPPLLRLDREKALQQVILRAIELGLLSSARALSPGGIAIALAKSCIHSKMGAEINMDPRKIRPDAALFSESPSRVLVTVNEEKLYTLKALLDAQDIIYSVLGKTGGVSLTIQVGDKMTVNLPIKEMEAAHQTGLSRYFLGEELPPPAPPEIGGES